MKAKKFNYRAINFYLGKERQIKLYKADCRPYKAKQTYGIKSKI